MSEKILAIIKAEFRQRTIEESLSRITQCLTLLSEDEIWYKLNENTNTVGNLVLHLAGNIRQYVISGIGSTPDNRERSLEFSSDKVADRKELLNKISITLIEANEVVHNLSYDQLSEEVLIQGFSHTRLSALMHVIEHLSYHVGQITYFTKYTKNLDTAYYGGMDLDVTSA